MNAHLGSAGQTPWTLNCFKAWLILKKYNHQLTFCGPSSRQLRDSFMDPFRQLKGSSIEQAAN